MFYRTAATNSIFFFFSASAAARLGSKQRRPGAPPAFLSLTTPRVPILCGERGFWFCARSKGWPTWPLKSYLGQFPILTCPVHPACSGNFRRESSVLSPFHVLDSQARLPKAPKARHSLAPTVRSGKAKSMMVSPGGCDTKGIKRQRHHCQATHKTTYIWCSPQKDVSNLFPKIFNRVFGDTSRRFARRMR